MTFITTTWGDIICAEEVHQSGHTVTFWNPKLECEDSLDIDQIEAIEQ